MSLFGDQEPPSAAAIRDRLEKEASRDAAGRFRVEPGASTLRAKVDDREPGISLAALERQAKAERLARESQRRERKRPRDERGQTAADLPPPVIAPERRTWLEEGLVVKVVADRAKAVVRTVRCDERGGVAQLELLASAERVELPATSLETVLPRLGGRVAVVAGAYAGRRGDLRALQEELYSCSVELAPDGVLVTLPYESVCKLA
jgi:hypothetical protein